MAHFLYQPAWHTFLALNYSLDAHKNRAYVASCLFFPIYVITTDRLNAHNIFLSGLVLQQLCIYSAGFQPH